MKFSVRRTSIWKDEIKPCEEAFSESYIRVDTRSVDCPTKLPLFKDDPERAKEYWYGEGSNHRVEDGYIRRDMEERSGWFVEINSLEGLVAFNEKYGSVVISDGFIHGYKEIEIYDDYRE